MSHWFDAETWQRLWATAAQTIAGVGLKLVLVCLVYWLARKTLFRLADSAMARLDARSAARGPDARGSDRAGRIRTLQTP
ncbi:MAG: hypothetical protein FJX72_13785, partial [Armatimonadetes bacterium]|nr:hypothetical protein [Armatimonadota bacterium]